MDTQDFLFVADLGTRYQGYLPSQAWDWINTQRRLESEKLSAGIQALSGLAQGALSDMGVVPGALEMHHYFANPENRRRQRLGLMRRRVITLSPRSPSKSASVCLSARKPVLLLHGQKVDSLAGHG